MAYRLANTRRARQQFRPGIGLIKIIGCLYLCSACTTSSTNRPASVPTSVTTSASTSSVDISNPSQNINYDDLFEQAFGRRPELPGQLDVPLRINTRFGKIVNIFNNTNSGQLEIEAESLLVQLERSVIDGITDDLRDAVQNDRVTLDALQAQGLIAAFNRNSLTLDITVPEELAKPVELEFSNRPEFDSRQLRKPAKLSAYLNLRSSIGYNTSDSDDDELDPLRVRLEANVNYIDIVFRHNHTYQRGSDNPWQRESTQLSYDDTRRLWRYSAGDITRYGIRGFQLLTPLAGVGVNKQFNIDPYENFTFGGLSETFTLTSESDIEIWNNGLRLRRVRLPPGEYNLNDLRLAPGFNEVTLRIIDSFGQVVEQAFNAFGDIGLLKPGTNDFAANLGVPSNLSADGRDYNNDELLFSGYYRRGLSSGVTAGVNAQGNADHWLLGAEAVYPTQAGTFSSDIAYSSSDQYGDGYAARLQHRYRNSWRDDNGHSLHNSWSLAAEYRSPDFEPPRFFDEDDDDDDSQLSGNGSEWRLSAQLNRSLKKDLSVSVAGNYEVPRDQDSDDAYSASLGLNKRFNNGVRVSGQLRHSRDNDGDSDSAVLATVSIPLERQQGQRYQEVVSRYDGSEDAVSVGYRIGPRNIIGPGSLEGNVELEHNPDGERLTGSARYRHQRFEVNLASRTANDSSENNDDDLATRTTLSFNTAIAYADGVVAVSRPINNSFALFKADPSLKGRRIAIASPGSLNRAGSEGEGEDALPDRYNAVIDGLGPGVIAELSPYYYRQLSADPQALPLGADLSYTDAVLLPSNRSGTVVDIGGAIGVILDGVLLDINGRPLQLEGGQLVRSDGNGVNVISMFTNRTGRFRVPSVPPGRYRLELYSYPDLNIEIEIPDTQEGIFNVGERRLQVASKN